jgi:predicted dehydrogenase
LSAIETGEPVWPTFKDGLAVSEVIEAIRASRENQTWAQVGEA